MGRKSKAPPESSDTSGKPDQGKKAQTVKSGFESPGAGAGDMLRAEAKASKKKGK